MNTENNLEEPFQKAYQIFATDNNTICQQMSSIIKLFERYAEKGDFQKNYDNLFNNNPKKLLL